MPGVRRGARRAAGRRRGIPAGEAGAGRSAAAGGGNGEPARRAGGASPAAAEPEAEAVEAAPKPEAEEPAGEPGAEPDIVEAAAPEGWIEADEDLEPLPEPEDDVFAFWRDEVEPLEPAPAGTVIADRYELVEVLDREDDEILYLAHDLAGCWQCGFESNAARRCLLRPVRRFARCEGRGAAPGGARRRGRAVGRPTGGRDAWSTRAALSCCSPTPSLR